MSGTGAGPGRAVFLDAAALGPADLDLGPLERALPGLELHDNTAPGELASRAAGATVLLVNKVELDAAALAALESLRLVCLAATGTDNVDLDAARQRGIAVANIRDYCTPSVAQHVFALILSLTHHIGQYRELTGSGAWSRHADFCMLDYRIRELAGKTLGIVGLGNLGGAVATVGRAFGMRVVAAARAGADYRDRHIERLPLSRLLAESDIVSLHCPLSRDTRGLIDAAALRSMRSDALLINTARGALVDSAALVAALRTGEIAGAGIDVLAHEPPADGDPLLDAGLPNLIVTPHVAWAAVESRQRAVDEMAKNVEAWRTGERRNRVD